MYSSGAGERMTTRETWCLVTKRDENINWLHGTIVCGTREYPYSRIASLCHDLDLEENMADALTLASALEMKEVCKNVMARPEKAQEIMRKNKLAIDDLDDPMQKLAFTFYSMMVGSAAEAERVLERAKEYLEE